MTTVPSVHNDDIATVRRVLRELGHDVGVNGAVEIIAAIQPGIEARAFADAIAEADSGRHIFGEATGGYVECMCGYPTREQYDSGEAEIVHILRAVRPDAIEDAS